MVITVGNKKYAEDNFAHEQGLKKIEKLANECCKAKQIFTLVTVLGK